MQNGEKSVILRKETVYWKAVKIEGEEDGKTIIVISADECSGSG